MKKVLIFFLLIIYSKTHGQFHDESLEFTCGLSLSMSYHRASVDELNSFLKKNGLKDIKSTYGNLGAGLNFRVNRHHIFFTGDVDINEDTKYNDSDVGTTSYSYSSNINYGYEFYVFDDMRLVPYVGFSRTVLKTKIVDKVQSNFDFQSVTTDRNSISVDNDTRVINLGSRFLMPMGDSEFSFVGFDINYGFKTSSRWTMNDVKVSNGPTINPGGLKIGIILLFMMGGE